MQWETVIGLEVHVQLTTAAKIFSGAATAFGAAPNTQACAVDLALPGVLPVLNKGAVERAIRFGLAIGARLNRINVFARKNYFYPDLPKGYQISQYERPIIEDGRLAITLGETSKTIRIVRAHLEEDAGKSLHEDFHGMTGIDLNRAGTPLLEIVSAPDLRSAQEAVAYARALHNLVTWIGICDGNMQEGSFRVDANVSVRPRGSDTLGTRREIKNLNSFRFLEQAIEYEARWQIAELEDGRPIRQATVLFDPDTGETRMMRSKEEAHDYRYFPDPDLLPVRLDEAWIEEVRAGLPELPQDKQARYQSELGLSAYDAATLTSSRALAEYFEAVLAAGAPAKPAANWVMGDLAAALNREGLDIAASRIAPAQLAGLIRRIEDGTLSSKLAKEVFAALWAGEGEVDAIIEARGLRQVSDSAELEAIIDQVIAANPKSVQEYRAGKEKAFNALVGQVMKATRGRANPQQVNALLKARLD
ncbi:MAG: Asp-tRNA(Asn)/Glu-tRNA(Gln) amidotransferase subunit GatB [Thiobacillaceae bacterium]|nr:Asp-tRNA(Asn)/Glu-tRNA(Gln) amidotransferase subunit GatB [Thiobacillaceae bacterium]MCX7672630.1 Asp-tRNA(Asn)/Glu-tRNA(Gln) amidotransferase subunit GatB [Thiobacillaceae bacterium]MDW8324162.1 Asp-tRNA(Asn)/Glu-tRNA(Gln) amidotransferase subunit GatB [Burkholderiales bacterium]